jgi:hypothetical protein
MKAEWMKSDPKWGCGDMLIVEIGGLRIMFRRGFGGGWKCKIGVRLSWRNIGLELLFWEVGVRWA